MHKFVATLLIGVYALFLQKTETLERMILGNWHIKSGKYIYYDNTNKRLKESRISGFEKTSIEVKSHSARIIYPNKEQFVGNYRITDEKGRQYVTVNLEDRQVKYEITLISKTAITLQARHNIEFYVDGDQKKKASYSVVIIQLRRI